MTAAARFHYRCSECGATHERDEARYLCPACGDRSAPGEPLRGVLEVVFDRFEDDAPPPCAVEPEFHPPFPVGDTPLLAAPRLARALGYSRLLVKNDGLNPSGSLKDRASFLVVAEALRIGERRIVTASTGNAAAALAAVCAATDRRAVILVPRTAPRAKLAQMLLHGAEVIVIDGTYDQAFQLSLDYTRERGGLNRNTAYNPLTIEGKKTAALEIFAQCGGRPPDVVVVPVGDGVILAGIHKGFADLARQGLADRLPRLVGVQAAGSAAIHRYVTTGEYRTLDRVDTIADSIAVAAPANAHLARRAVAESGGFTLTVSDAEILAAQELLARTTGVFAEPAAAATVAALAAADTERLDRGATIVLLVTGHGLKDIDAPLARIEVPAPVAPRLEAITP